MRHLFNGEDRFRVLDLHARVTLEANLQEKSDTQIFGPLPSFLKGFAINKYNSMAGRRSRQKGGLYAGPKWFNITWPTMLRAKISGAL